MRKMSCLPQCSLLLAAGVPRWRDAEVGWVHPTATQKTQLREKHQERALGPQALPPALLRANPRRNAGQVMLSELGSSRSRLTSRIQVQEVC